MKILILETEYGNLIKLEQKPESWFRFDYADGKWDFDDDISDGTANALISSCQRVYTLNLNR